MDRISLNATERIITGKKVKNLRRDGFIPAHVFGNKVESENVTVKTVDFLKVYKSTGESGLIDLKIGAEKIKPVLVRKFQLDPVRDLPVHIDFYQVNLNKPVQVTVSIIIEGEQPELVHMGEAVVVQPLNEVEVEALPANLPENITVDITSLKQIDDAILVSQLKVPEGVTILADPDSLVVKLDNAITEEMKKIMEEEAAAAQAALEAQAATEAESGETPAEGEGEAVEGETPVEGAEVPAEEIKDGEEKVEPAKE